MRAKRDAEGFQSTLRGDLGHWFRARRPGDQTHPWSQSDVRDQVHALHYGTTANDKDLAVLEAAARGLKFLRQRQQTDYQAGVGAPKHGAKTTAFSPLPYGQASKLPMQPMIWDKPRSAMCAPPIAERSSQQLEADLLAVRAQRMAHEEAAQKARDDRIAATSGDWVSSKIQFGFETK
jgi:hypothetical protein